MIKSIFVISIALLFSHQALSAESAPRALAAHEKEQINEILSSCRTVKSWSFCLCNDFYLKDVTRRTDKFILAEAREFYLRGYQTFRDKTSGAGIEIADPYTSEVVEKVVFLCDEDPSLQKPFELK